MVCAQQTNLKVDSKHLVGTSIVGGRHNVSLLFKVKSIRWIRKSHDSAGLDIVLKRSDYIQEKEAKAQKGNFGVCLIFECFLCLF